MSITPLISEGDLQIGDNGRPVFIDGKDKLLQDLTHCILCPRGNNRFHQMYGSSVMMRIGYPIKPGTTAMNIQKSVVDAINYYMQIQTVQEKYQEIVPAEKVAHLGNEKIWSVSQAELLQSLNSIDVDIDIDTITLKIRITTAIYEEIIVPFTIYLVPGHRTIESDYQVFRFTKYDIGSIYDSGYVYMP